MRVVAIALLIALLVARPPSARAATQTLRYLGTRVHTFSGAQYRPAFDDRFTVVDDVTVERTGNAIERRDDLDFTPDGDVAEEPVPNIERRTREERIAPRDGGRGVAILIMRESTTTDVPSIFTNVHLAGASPYQTTDIDYGAPRTAVVLGGPRAAFSNGIARTVSIESADTKQTATVTADGTVDSSGDAFATTEKLAQRADGTATYRRYSPGFSLYDLDVQAPKNGPTGKTIGVLRTTQGRTVGPAPITTESFTPTDWYPGGTLGPDRDDGRALGFVRLPHHCGPKRATATGYETVEERSRTRVNGFVETIATTTFTRGDLTLCSIETIVTKQFEPTTGALVSTDTDTTSLHLAASRPAVSLRLFGLHDNSPLASNVNPHATGPPSRMQRSRSIRVSSRSRHSTARSSRSTPATSPARRC